MQTFVVSPASCEMRAPIQFLSRVMPSECTRSTKTNRIGEPKTTKQSTISALADELPNVGPTSIYITLIEKHHHYNAYSHTADLTKKKINVF